MLLGFAVSRVVLHTSRACSSTLEHNRVIPREVSRDMADSGGKTEPHSLVRRPN